MVLPALWSGYSGKELTRWPGTIRVRTRVVADVVYDVVHSLTDMGFAKIIIVNGHGHHPAILEMVAREIADDTGVYIAVMDAAKLAAQAVQAHRRSAPGGCIHGGEFETSLMLHLGRPVDMDLATDEDTFTFESPCFPKDGFAGSKKAFWSTWGIQASKTGIYGTPSVATEEFGRVVFEAMVQELVTSPAILAHADGEVRKGEGLGWGWGWGNGRACRWPSRPPSPPPSPPPFPPPSPRVPVQRPNPDVVHLDRTEGTAEVIGEVGHAPFLGDTVIHPDGAQAGVEKPTGL